MADVFISHSSKDKAIADRLCEALEAKGLKCWIAPRDIVPGSEWAAAISEAISTTRVMLLIYSHNSAQSTQVPKEVNIAEKRGKLIIPYKIDDAELVGAFDYFLTGAHWIVANPAANDYKVDELYGVITGVMQVNPQNVTNNTYIDNLTINNPTPVNAAVEKSQANTVMSEHTVATATSDAEAKKKKTLIGIFAGIGALLVILLVVLIVVLGGKKDNADDKEVVKNPAESQGVVDNKEPEITAAPEVTEEPEEEKLYTPAENFEYAVKDNKIVITKYVGTIENVVIPAEMNGLPVAALGEKAFYQCAGLKSVVISEGITDLGTWTFAESSLESITIPEGVTKIGDSVFYKCANLTKVDIPTSVTEIDVWAFGNSGLTEVVIPHGVTKIPVRAFNKCENLVSVIIPEGVTIIEDSAFYLCYDLNTITLPSTLEKIESWAFAEAGLTEITIPNSVETIGDRAFYKCPSLSSVTFGEGLKSIGEWAFTETPLVEVELPKKVEYLGHAVFYNCAFLESAVLPEGLTQVPTYGFYGCSKLKKLTLSSNLMVINEWAFAKTAFENVGFAGSNIKYFGVGAFSDCPNLTTVVLPDTLVTLDAGAFQKCDKLKSVTIPDGVKIIYSNTFSSSPNAVITYKGNTYGQDQLSEIYRNLRIEATKNFEYTITDGEATITKYIGTDADVAVPAYIENAKVTEIGENAFAERADIINVYIPGSVAYVGSNAFMRCTSLKNIVIPSSVTSIGYGVFRESAITQMTIPAGQEILGYCLFYGCDNLKYVSIPNGVTSIGEHVFSQCDNLAVLRLPDDIAEIKSNAFEECVNLTIIHKKTKYTYENRGNVPGTVAVAE